MILPNDVLHGFANKKSINNTTGPITTFSLSRNISVAKFLPCLCREKKLELLNTIASHFNHIEGFEEFFVLPLKDLPLWQREFIAEHFLFPYDLAGNPEGEAFIVSRSGDILVGINFYDHLLLHAIDFYSDPEKILEKLVRLDSYLHEKLSFAFSSDFGFLTTNPRNAGTGLRCKTFLHAPALLHSQEISDVINDDSEISVSGILPSISGYAGNIVVLSNKYSLGVTEEQILSSLRIGSSKLSVAETSAKKKYANEHTCELKNHVLRALGLLTHSYCLELKETLDALSWVQLGLELGWIQGNSENTIWVPPFWQVRRGHLAFTKQPEEKNLEKETILQLRAAALKELANELTTRGF
ncbi:guanido phosphotransferase, C-terminal catalytic domain protein [Chlamydia ibidis]|uniref:Guanido phosphotransferase, C-terminal catalytic domain protein n=2 Tax=Chlamydia ibidis TaxID=1405396 RepID=S7J2P3_9CHLA|nr:protein arginine kinase [Chlamydia ibidis]EPP34513.1 guanido phosphotransferase, C-terminal catalytic domain protein [Chlamydia ibidis]EQM62920.1 guanido phosphotransferase, C-terminal catalytic domain protein [Chlamydia ibidis 10-1398/6]